MWTPAPTPTLELSCALDTVATSPALSVFARISHADDNANTVVTLTVGARVHTFQLQGRQGIATFEEGNAPVGSVLPAVATTNAGTVTGVCTVFAGLERPLAAAHAVPAGAEVTWSPVSDAAVYRLKAVDFATGEVLATADANTSPAMLQFAAPADDVVVVEFLADALADTQAHADAALPAPRRCHVQLLLTHGNRGGSAAAWQLFGPGDFVHGALSIRYPQLAADERVAVLLLNANGVELGSNDVPAATVRISGLATNPPDEGLTIESTAMATSPPTPRQVPTTQRTIDVVRAALGVAADVAPTNAPTLGETRELCVCDWSNACAERRRITATVRHRTPNAAFWVEQSAQAGFDTAIADSVPRFWQDLGSAYEERIRPVLITHFGALSDVNQDGVMSLVFADLGAAHDGQMVVGYLDLNDLQHPADTTPDCTGEGAGSNGFDAVYLRDLASYAQAGGSGFTAEYVLGEMYPNTIAHELQHDINFNMRWLLPTDPQTSVFEQTWLDEALSRIAADFAGFGLSRAVDRRTVGNYLQSYASYSLTNWQGDANGSYGGAHAFLRYFVDRFGPELVRRLERRELSGKDNFASATKMPFYLAFAQFATASLFSNEAFSPSPLFDYTGAPWTPWHEVVGQVKYNAFTPDEPGVTMRLLTDGWDSYVSSPGDGGSVELTVESDETRPPYVVAVKHRRP